MAETLLHSLNAVGVVLLLTACGYFVAALGWMSPEAKAFLSKFLMRVAVPVMCVYSLRTNLTREMLQSSWAILLVPALTSGLLAVLAELVGRALRLEPKQRSVFRMMCCVSNAMFIGYSMCRELFGEACTPYVMLFYLINTGYAQFVGVMGIRRASGQGGSTPGQAVLAFLRTPSIVGMLIGILVILVDWQPPALLMSSARYINNTVTPLALLLAGNIIHEIGLKNLRIDRVVGATMAFRFLLAPAICLTLCGVLGVQGLARDALVVQTGMPVLTQAVVASTEYGGDEKLAARSVAVTTLACFVVIPILMLLLQ